MPICTINNVWDITTQLPCCGMRWPLPTHVIGWCCRCLKVIPVIEWLRRGHFTVLLSAVRVVTAPRTGWGTYLLKYPPSCSSTTALRRFASTSGLFVACQSSYSSKRNCYMSQLCTWRPWDKTINLFSKTLNRGRTFPFAVRSWIWYYTAHKVWWKCVRIIRWQIRRGFCLCPGLIGRRPGITCICLTFARFTLFITGIRFSILMSGSFSLFLTIIFFFVITNLLLLLC